MSSSRRSVFTTLARLAALAAVLALAACGGGGGGGGNDNPGGGSTPPPPTLAASSAANATTAGGASIALTATVTNANAPVTWSLTGPGSLSATTGVTIDYVPPAPDTLQANTQATITATLGTLTQSVTLAIATTPGNTWEMTTTPSLDGYGVLAANGGWIVVGSSGEILRSADGIAWAPVHSGTPNDLHAVAYGPPGYVAVGMYGTIVFSADGNTWRVAALPPSANAHETFTGVIYADGRFLALSAGGPSLTSTDGVTWTPSSLTTQGCGQQSVPATNGTRIVVSCGGLFYSDDALTWHSASSAPGGTQLAYGNGVFALYNGTQVATSADGVTWSAPVAASAGGYPSRLRFVNGSFFVVGQNSAYQSTDGVTWAMLPHTFSDLLFDIAPGPSGGTIVVGAEGLIQTSPDLATWTDVGPPFRDVLGGVAWNNGVFVMLDINQVLWSSPDGRTWTQIALTNPNSEGSISTISAAHGLFLATGTNTVMTSPDGVTWTNQPVPQGNYFGAATWANGLWVVVCEESDTIFTSPDLQAWTAAYTDGLGNSTDGDVGIAYAQGRFVALQQDGTFVTSADGVTWTAGTQPTVAGSAMALGAGANGFVAMGGGGVAYFSADGLTWTPTTLDTNFDNVTYANGRYVAVGGNGEVVTSTDGQHWTYETTGTDVPLGYVAYGAGEFVTVGSNGAIAISTH